MNTNILTPTFQILRKHFVLKTEWVCQLLMTYTKYGYLMIYLSSKLKIQIFRATVDLN